MPKNNGDQNSPKKKKKSKKVESDSDSSSDYQIQYILSSMIFVPKIADVTSIEIFEH